MDESFFDPIKEYQVTYKNRHRDNVKDCFESLLTESQIDLAANQLTCQEYYKKAAILENEKKMHARLRGLRIFMIILMVLLLVATIIMAVFFFGVYAMLDFLYLYIGIGTLVLAVVPLLIFIIVLNPRIKAIRTSILEKQAEVEALKALAYRQVQPLLALFHDDLAIELVEKTMPAYDFDPIYSAEVADLFSRKYGLEENLGPNSSVLTLRSGRLFNSPFMLAKVMNHEMGLKTYTGTLTIHWTTTERGSDGHTHIRSHTQTLTANLTKPYPYYYTGTRFIFGNEAAPNLSFTRKPTDYSQKEGKDLEKAIQKGIKKFDKKAEKSVGVSNFTTMANSEFEVLFHALDRSNDVEFRLLFSPLAQQQMCNLIKDKTVGYGDDFNYNKLKMLNILTPLHLDGFDISGSQRNFVHFDAERIRELFDIYNNEYFRQLYFTAAPITAIPLFLMHKPSEFIYKDVYPSNLGFWQHECIANRFPGHRINPIDSITQNIIKTQVQKKDDDCDVVQTISSGFYGVNRVDYVNVYGGDGRSHSVPVHWVEYFPTQRTENFAVKVDPKIKEKSWSAKIRERLSTYFRNQNLDIPDAQFKTAMVAMLLTGTYKSIGKKRFEEFFK